MLIAEHLLRPSLHAPFAHQILKDSDTLSSRKVIDGAAMHLFQRPKDAPVVSGIGMSNAPQPSGLTEIPSMMLQVQGASVSDEPQNQGLLDEHWEVETPRRTMRFLASVLILISIMQVQYSSKPSLILLLFWLMLGSTLVLPC